MDARFRRAACALLCSAAFFALGGSYRTQNFIVDAATDALAKEIGDAAEKYRHDLAMEWLGKPLPAWRDPCPIRVAVGNMGAGGATSFMFDRGRPFGWSMTVQGTRERVLDSVLPHEVTHAIFATHFGRPLPRWADEGACTTVEHASEKKKQEDNLLVFLTTDRGIAFNQMFAMTEYPTDVLPLYSQGYSLARFLIAQGGKRKYVDYVGDGMRLKNWTAATKQHYGYESLSELQLEWVDWVRKGSKEQLAAELAAARQAKTAANSGESALAATATSARPAPILAANTASRSERTSDGWYARKRDEARAATTLATRTPKTNASETGSASDEPLDTSHHELPAAILVGRPQAMARPATLILENSRPPAASTRR